MARIRTVKPEFWTDEKVVECSIPARLLFIGLFNFADDKGCMERSPRRIKMQVFPADTIDCEPLIMELITHGLLTEYSVNDSQYLQIKGFCKHQKINRPSKSNIPEPIEITESMPEYTGNSVNVDINENKDSLNTHGLFSEYSVNTHGVLTDGKEVEGKGKEKDIDHGASAGADDHRQSAGKINYQSILDAYHELLPEMPQIKILTDAKKNTSGHSGRNTSLTNSAGGHTWATSRHIVAGCWKTVLTEPVDSGSVKTWII